MKNLSKYLWLTILLSVSAFGQSKVTMFNGHPAPADVNLDWSKFHVSDPFGEVITDSKYDLNKALVPTDEAIIRIAVDLAWQLSIRSYRNVESEPYKNNGWLAARDLYEDLINNPKVQENPRMLGICLMRYILHLVGANSKCATFTLRPEVNEAINKMKDRIKKCNQENNISTLISFRQSLYFEAKKPGRVQWSKKQEFDQFFKQAKLNVQELQLANAIIFSYMQRDGTEPVTYWQYFEEKIFPSYEQNGIFFSSSVACFTPYFSEVQIMRDIEGSYQNMMMLKYAKTPAFRPVGEKRNIDE